MHCYASNHIIQFAVMHSVETRVALQINSLLGAFEQHTGQSFGGSDSDYSILSELVRDALHSGQGFGVWHWMGYGS